MLVLQCTISQKLGSAGVYVRIRLPSAQASSSSAARTPRTTHRLLPKLCLTRNSVLEFSLVRVLKVSIMWMAPRNDQRSGPDLCALSSLYKPLACLIESGTCQKWVSLWSLWSLFPLSPRVFELRALFGSSHQDPSARLCKHCSQAHMRSF